MFTPIHIMLMTNHLVQQNQMFALRHRQQQARNDVIKSKPDDTKNSEKTEKED